MAQPPARQHDPAQTSAQKKTGPLAKGQVGYQTEGQQRDEEAKVAQVVYQ